MCVVLLFIIQLDPIDVLDEDEIDHSSNLEALDPNPYQPSLLGHVAGEDSKLNTQ